MTIEVSDTPCPECGSDLQVIYVTELRQVVSGWACTECGFLASESDRFRGSVPKPERREYVLRRETSLTSDDVRDPLGDVADEFRARADAEIEPEEVWLLIDPETETVVDAAVGEGVDDDGTSKRDDRTE